MASAEPTTNGSETDELQAVVQSEAQVEVKAPPTRRATRATVVKKPAAAPAKAALAPTKRSKKVAEQLPSSEPVTETEQEDAAVPLVPKSKGKVASETTVRSKPAASATASAVRAKPTGLPKLKTPTAARTKKVAPPPPPPRSATDQSEDQDEDRDRASPTPMQIDQPDPERMKMIDTGAKEARSVIESLDQVTPGKSTASTTPDTALALTDEQADMTVVEYIRAMYEAKHRAIKAEGEAKIKAWEDRARTARELVQGMRCRDDGE